jgi:hypothetical protein
VFPVVYRELVSDEEKELALGELVGAIRRDLSSGKIIRETTLNGKDFKHLTATGSQLLAGLILL